MHRSAIAFFVVLSIGSVILASSHRRNWADELLICCSKIFADGYAVKVFHRRRVLHLAAGAVAQPALARVAWAQTYPTRPVRLIVGCSPGGSSDLFARLIGRWL